MVVQKIVGIDFGLKRIGLALSDASNIFAFPWKKVAAGRTPEESATLVWEDVKKEMVTKQFQISLFVVGLPKTMKNEMKERAEQVELFAKKLELISEKPIQYMDERLSTVQAERSLKELTLTRKERSKHIDEVSAALLLQSYLDRQRP